MAILDGCPDDAPVVVLDANEQLVEVEDCYFIADKRTTYFDPQIIPRSAPVVRIV
jgi:hypothetical protein